MGPIRDIIDPERALIVFMASVAVVPARVGQYVLCNDRVFNANSEFKKIIL